MNAKFSFSSSYRLIASQGLNAFGDHCVKITASALIAAQFSEKQASLWVGIVSALYVIPFVVFAPLAARLCERYSKLRVVRSSLLLQAFAMGALSVSAAFGSFAGVMLGLSMVAIQSGLLAPSRNALLKELCGTERIGKMMGLLGMAGIGATLAGLAIGGWSFDGFWWLLGSPWSATAAIGLLSAVIALLAWWVVGSLKGRQELESEEVGRFSRAIVSVFRQPALRWSSLGLAWFYGVGAMMTLILLQDSRWDHGQELGSASQGGAMSALLGLGVALGSGLSAWVCRRKIEVGLSIAGAIGVAVFTPLAALLWGTTIGMALCVFLLGVSGGMFSAPLNALFVARAKAGKRVASIAVNNLVINIVAGGFVLLASWLSYQLWSPVAQLWVIAASSFIVLAFMVCLVPESLIRMFALGFAKLVYPARVLGAERIPQDGGLLIVANHVSYADAILIAMASPRPVRFVGTDEMLRFPWMRWVYGRFNVIPVSSRNAKDAITKTVDALRAGDAVCLFPEGALTRTGMTMPFKKGAELIARLSGARVAPVSIDGMWGSVFSFADKPFRFRFGMPLRRKLTIRFSQVMEPRDATTQSMRDAILQGSHESFCERENLQGSLGYMAFERLRESFFKVPLIDRGLGRTVRGAVLMGLARLVARCIRKSGDEPRVGVLLPPGLAGFAANIGVAWAGKSSVNFNPTVGPEFFRNMLERSGVRRLISSRIALKRFENLDFDRVELVFIEDLIPAMKSVRSMVELALMRLLPLSWAASMFQVASKGGEQEATLLFSSGSSSEPKGIPLSHRNLLANVTQLSECYLLKKEDALLANLPLFHSFGLTGGLWLPLALGIRIIATPSPLMVKENLEAIREERATALFGTPTFLRSYLKRGTKEDMKSLRMVIAGGERMPLGLAREWEAAFGIPVLEGYGLTECSPVVAANCLQSLSSMGRYPVLQSGSKLATVGRPMPGTLVRLVDQNDEGRCLAEGESGTIQVKGPSVFSAYLGEGAANDRFVEGDWFDTGDVGHFDGDGFLVIEGRNSRFSKVAGEMVSHIAIEDAIAVAYPEIGGEGEAVCFVGTRRCESKGEQLVLLTTLPLELPDVTARLRRLGVPNLWMPQALVSVELLPQLGTGKLDLKACARLCSEGLEAKREAAVAV